MNRVHVRRLATAAFAFFWLGLSSAPAEVKLRIYMQDGSLQAGNLITETTDSFVILGKDGRVELQKKNIMFVNGKTLKQWNDRPDKLFQTEIIPSDVPDPSFVNNKAPLPLPPAPVIEKKVDVPPALKAPVASSRSATPVAVLAPVEPVAPAAAPVAARSPATIAPKAQAPKPEPRSHRKVKIVAAPAAEPPVVAAAPVETAPVPARRPGSRRLGERAVKGAAHREHGFALLSQGDTGQAMQELMIARLFEPDNGDTNLALGRIHEKDGLHDAALKYLGHWTLRKSDAAAAEIAAINREVEGNARSLFHLQIAVGAGVFSWLPFVLAYRRFRRRRLAARASDAKAELDKMPAAAEAESAPAKAPDWVKQVEARFTEAAPVAPPAPIKMAPPPIKVTPPPAPVAEPVAPEPVPAPFEFIREEEVFSEEPPATPISEAPAPMEEPVVEEIVQPRIEEPAMDAPAEEIEPAFEPAAASNDFDPSEILAMARSVENSLVRANAAAAAGRVDEARRGYRTALVLNADCASAHLGLGYLAFMEEKWDTALLHYREALKIDPQSADAHYGAARVLLEINRVDDAVPELRATLTIDPTHDDARDALTAIGKPA